MHSEHVTLYNLTDPFFIFQSNQLNIFRSPQPSESRNVINIGCQRSILVSERHLQRVSSTSVFNELNNASLYFLTTSFIADKHLSSSRTVYIAKFLALLRLLRICRLVRYLSRCQESFYTSSSWIYIRILNLSLLMLLVAHWNACLQFLVNFCLGFPDRCWIAQSNLQVFTRH